MGIEKEDKKNSEEIHDKEETSKDKDSKKKNSKTMIFVSVVLAAALIALIIFIINMTTSSSEIKVGNITFAKSPLGDLMFYKAYYPVIYGSPMMGYVIGSYKEVLFRNDPRTLGNIPINLSYGMKIVGEGRVYVSIDKDIKACSDNGLAMIDLGRFFAVAGYDIKGAVNDPDYSNSTTTPYVNCETHPENTVILIKSGNVTKIEQTAKNCYQLVFKECEVSRVGERFQLLVFNNTLANFARLQSDWEKENKASINPVINASNLSL